MKSRKISRVKYDVQCAFNAEHIFEKVFEIEEGSEDVQSEVETYCPFCDKMVKVTIKGEPIKKTLYRNAGQ